MRFAYRQFAILILLLAASFVSVNAQSLVYASNQLEQMAKMMQMTDKLKKLPEGVSLRCDSYNSVPLTVVKKGNVVKHIGYSVFSIKQRERVGETRSNFIERFLLSTDLPFNREKTVEEEMMEEKIAFRSGNLSLLKSFAKDSSLSVDASLVKEKLHDVKWMREGKTVCEIGFPANHELLTGRNMLENDNRLQMDILLMADSVVKGRYSFQKDALKEQEEVFVLSGGSYLSDELLANRYFLKNADGSFSPLCTPIAPRESLANLLSANDIPNNFSLEITLKQYNYREATFSVPLTKWVEYYKEQGCKPYFCVIGQEKSFLDCLLLLRNEDLGCCHVMRLRFDTDMLEKRKGKITARLNAFVPTSNIKDLYYENKI